jgi:hypothetical protein
MTSRTRSFLIGSVFVMTVILCTGLVAFYNGGLGRADLPSNEMAYLPADLGVIGYADVHAVMNSEFRQRIKQLLPTGEEIDRLKNEIGVDVERDIDTVVAGFSSAGPDHPGAIALLRGRFNDGQIETIATQHGAVAETYRGKRLVLTQGNERGGVAFLEPGLIALGEAATLKKAIDAQAAGDGMLKNAQLMQRVNEIQIGHKAWLVGRVDAMPHPELPTQFKDTVAAVQWFAIGANVNGALNGTLRAIARDEAAAQNLREMATGGLAAAKLFAGQDPKLQSLANSVQISGMGNSVAVTFTVSPELLDMLGGMAGAHQSMEQHRSGIQK